MRPSIGLAPAPQPQDAGRICPADYRYPPSVFHRPPQLAADVLYVVGGLYGNLAALDEVERMARLEQATLVFNGDFHWFDAQPDWFAEVDRRVARHQAMRGNVESELARSQDIGAGCGCAYPASVDEDTVRRSNEILIELRRTTSALPGVAARLAGLPMHLVAQVGALRIGIVHGDATGLAGWAFAHDALDDRAASGMLNAIHRAARVDLFCSTHTCLPALRDFRLQEGRLSIINNGSAGMPNFRGMRFGVVSRVAVTPSPHRPLYGFARDGVHIDALTLRYDHDAFVARFLARWPEGSAAHAAYFRRIISGPTYVPAQARPRSLPQDSHSYSAA